MNARFARAVVLTAAMVTILAAFAFGGCAGSPGPAHSPERFQSLAGGGPQKDACLLAPTNANEVGYCDAQSAACGRSCPM
jgi:hypothetical protein